MHESGHHLRGIALAAGGMILISPDGLMFRLIAEASDLQIVFWRGLISCFVITTYVQLRHPGGMFGALRLAGAAGLISAVLFAAGHLLFVMSITRTAVANTLVILAMLPMLAAVLGWLLLRERVHRGTMIAIFLAFGGIVVVFSGSLQSFSLLGDALALAATVTIALNLILIRANPQVSMLPALALSGAIAALAVLPFVDGLVLPASDFAVIALMGTVAHSLAFGMVLAAVRYLPSAEVSLFTLIETVLGPFWAWVGAGEEPAGNAILGGAIVVTTLALHSSVRLYRIRRRAAAQ